MSIRKFLFGLASIRKALAENQKTKLEKEFELNKSEDDFAAHFYDEINNVIGGTNPNEKLTLLLPGIALTKSDFEYDYKNNAPKDPVIEANESRLANKLYDPFDLVGGDNGKTLEHQYRSALDMLTPKLNPIIAHAKNELRDLLMKPFPYKFGPKNIKRAEVWNATKTDLTPVPADIEDPISEETKTYTFQEVFFRLYNNYVDQLAEWADQRQNRRELYQIKAEKLVEKTPNISESDKNRWAENEYLKWYENNGEKWLTAINQKLSVLLSVFSATDMKIVEGILDSGSGAELQEARQTMNNTRKINPDGGYIYPVKFNPTNWFEYLDTSFTPVDLVNSPTAILDELKILYNRRDYLNSRITDIASQIPSTKDIEDIKKQVEDARAEYNRCDDALQDAMDKGFGDFAKFLAVTICSACCPPAGAAALATESVQKSVTEGKTTATKTLTDQKIDIDSIKEKVTNVLNVASTNKKEETKSKLTDIFDTIKKVVSDETQKSLITNAETALTNLSSTISADHKTTFAKNINSLCNINLDSLISSAKSISEDTSKSENERNEASEKLESLEEAKSAVSELKNIKEEAEKTLSTDTASELGNSPSDNLKQAKADLNMGASISNGIDIVFEGGTRVNMAQSAYLTSISNYTGLLQEQAEKEGLAGLQQQLSNFNMDKNAVESKIKLLQDKLGRVDNFEECFSESVNPPAVPDGFTQFNIVHTITNTSSESKSSSSSSTSSSTSGFWIFKSKKRTTHRESHIEKLCKSDGTEIQIGMNIAKVGIEREWFNPGVFALTEEMYNVAEKTTEALKEEEDKLENGEKLDKVLRISHGADKEDKRAMERLSHDVFPCYTTAMVIARDVTIKLTTTSNSDYSKSDTATDEVSKSKAFFVYNAGDGSRTHTASGKSKSKSNSRTITIRFTTPQVIGFYQQIVPEDKSTAYPSTELQNDESCIVNFIKAYEKAIQDRMNAENAV